MSDAPRSYRWRLEKDRDAKLSVKAASVLVKYILHVICIYAKIICCFAGISMLTVFDSLMILLKEMNLITLR